MVRLGRAMGAFCLAAGAVCGAAGFATAEPADDAGPPVTVAVDGESFSTHPAGAMRLEDAAPGSATSMLLGVRSGVSSASAVSLQVLDHATSDARPLSDSVRFAFSSSDAHGGAGDQLWSGSGAQLAQPRQFGLVLAPGATTWIRVQAAIPTAAGNEVASQTFDFDLRVDLQAAGLGVGGVTVGRGSSTPSGHGSGPSGSSDGTRASGHGVDAETDTTRGAATDGVAGLAVTGVPLTLLVVAALFIASGVAMVIGARRRGREESTFAKRVGA